MDDNNNKTLELEEFRKACRDFRVDVADNEIGRLFNAFDRDGSGAVDYDELLRYVRGPMNQFRINLVKQAFKKIDKTGDGVLDLSDLKGTYNAKHHPDVKAGKKTEEDILCEFLDTFEMHHSLATGGTGRDSRVT
jgi:Ca2+-binding EF-hand superfamily protein